MSVKLRNKIKLGQESEDVQCLKICCFQAQIKSSLYQNLSP